MTPTKHAAASAAFSAVFAYFTHSLWGTVICFLSGIFIDLDHVLDYWLDKRKAFFHYRELYSFCCYEKNGRLRLIFHAYEWFVLLWLAVFLLELNVLWWGFAVGVTAHFLLDVMYNPVRHCGYSFFYRFKHGFSKKAFFPEEVYRKLT